ncbi:hypothetical protein LOK49_LG06G02053 [Camellia lanceoleosa]|uniref:Uncharacterized protein n=1 Tax=Camellia lanceoleosa TaxID=1840588 RepID=A0ACC0HBI2_9ERIC|nr:hypothetical protein LOK49_LG06G02053 [Camellia lanceoleosa]
MHGRERERERERESFQEEGRRRKGEGFMGYQIQTKNCGKIILSILLSSSLIGILIALAFHASTEETEGNTEVLEGNIQP